MAKVAEIIAILEKNFPLQLQENYDNSGLITGNTNQDVTGILFSIDITEKVVEEAIENGYNMIISHHPIIFQPLKSITGKTRSEQVVIKAIKNDIAIYAAHTNLDNSFHGLNKYIADKLEMRNLQILIPQNELLLKIATFVPLEYANKVRQAMFDAGAGHIGNYDSCSYNIEGQGTFKANEGTNPFVGEIGKIHKEKEIKIETISTAFCLNKVIEALKGSHPYEEPAFDIYQLKNKNNIAGTGIIGFLQKPLNEIELLEKIKKIINIKVLKHSNLLNKKVEKIAICTGSGGIFMNDAIAQNADIYISAEFKYSMYLDAINKILIVDAGHFETEIFSINIFYDIISKKFNTFALAFSKQFENPVKYL